MKLSPYSLLIACFFTLTTAAQDALESSDLGLVQQQISTLELLADRARSSAADSNNPRYRFDYPRLAADFERVRHGIDSYLSPSRAQPADLVELAGDYRADACHSSPSNEHD